MKVIFSTTLVLLLLTGCIAQPEVKDNTHKPTLSDLQDVSYHVDKKGDVKLVKKYISVDKATKKKKIIYDYERVPKFDNAYSKTLSRVKEKKIFMSKGIK